MEESATGKSGSTGSGKLPPLWKNRDFLRLWIGAGSTLLGTGVATTAYPLLIIWFTGSAVGAGLVGFAAMLPRLLVQLPAGVLVDRWDRRRLMITCDILGLVTMGSVAAALIAGRFWLPHIMAAAFVQGSAAIFYRLAERAAVRNVVEPGHLSAALAQNEARGQAAALIGQPTAGSLFVAAKWLPFAFAAFSHLLALLTLLPIKKKFQLERVAEPRRIRTELAEGFVWVWRQRFVRDASVLIALTNLVFQVLGLALVVLIKEGGGSPMAVGTMGAVAGVGGILGALTGSWWIKRLTPVSTLIGTVLAWAVFMTPMGFTSNPFILGGLYAGMNYAAALMGVAGGIYQIQITPDEMQGRVTSVGALLASGANSAGAMAGGFLLAALGASTTVLAAAGVMFVMAVGAALSPGIRSARDISLVTATDSGSSKTP
ncbi:MFS transporter [Streptomyces sp. NPDC007076]|uniref:MFS transporter n=1 Tax=unclassified Streptomyces TaxID=2593676 RepID=UPI00225070B8|nr:MFS transporter [Streptomyces sp. NBC_01500]MCX4553661.1 MFS transporter [Streptomyces sp. NBC_01500]